MNFPGLAMLAVSAALLGWVAMRLARTMASGPAERFWVAVAAIACQLGTVAVGLSPLRALTPGGFLAAQGLLALVVAIWTRKRNLPNPLPRTRWPRLDAVSTLLLLVAATLVAVMLFEQAYVPLGGIDERNYHASRTAYWLQHRTLFSWETHNDRQTVFPFGSHLWFFWGVLFTRDELWGRLAYAMALPLSAAGVWTVAAAAGGSLRTRSCCVATWCATPAVFANAVGLHPDLWAATFTLAAAFFGLRWMAGERGRSNALAWCGVFVALAAGAKTTALGMAGSLAMLALLSLGRADETPRHLWPRIAWPMAGFLIAAAAGGLLFNVVQNFTHYGHPLGPSEMRRIHAADPSVRQVFTHAARFAGELLEPPWAPESVADAWARAGNRALAALSLDRPLPGEDQPWPGAYQYVVSPRAVGFSWGGWLFLGGLTMASGAAVRAVVRAFRREAPGPIAVLGLFILPLLAVNLFTVRWMGGNARFFLAPYALALVLAIVGLARVAQRSIPRAVLTALFAYGLISSAAGLWSHAWGALSDPYDWIDEPFIEVLGQVPEGSTILLVAGQETRDYPLFAPRRGFANRVIPWGKRAFDPRAMRDLIEREGITHVLITDWPEVDFHWAPPLRTAEMIDWLRDQEDLANVPLHASRRAMLFARRPLLPPPRSAR